MQPILAILNILRPVNTGLLTVGRWIGVAAIAAMVIAILIQVFFRYVLGNALPWPDEAARCISERNGTRSVLCRSERERARAVSGFP